MYGKIVKDRAYTCIPQENYRGLSRGVCVGSVEDDKKCSRISKIVCLTSDQCFPELKSTSPGEVSSDCDQPHGYQVQDHEEGGLCAGDLGSDGRQCGFSQVSYGGTPAGDPPEPEAP